MVEGWVRGGQGLGYLWVVVRVGWVYEERQEGRQGFGYGVVQEGRDEGRVVCVRVFGGNG